MDLRARLGVPRQPESDRVMIWVFYLLVFFLPFQNHYLVNTSVGPITLLKGVGLLLFFLAIVRSAIHGIPKFWGSVPAKALFFFAFWRVLSWIFAGKALPELSGWTSYGIANVLSALLFLFVTVALVDSKEKLRRTILVCVAAMALGGIYIIRGYLGGDDRPGWPFQDANYYALYAMTVLPISLAIPGTEKRKLLRLGCYVSIVLCLIGLLLSASRAGFLTLLLFGFIQAVRGKSVRQRIGLVLALVVCSIFMAPKAIERLLHPGPHDIESNYAHQAFVEAAWKTMRDHPLLGVGPSAAYFEAYLPEVNLQISGVAHNTLLELGAESGVPALLAYLCIIGSGWVLLRRKAREFAEKKEKFLEDLSRGLQFSLINSSLIGLTVSASFLRFLWFTFILVMLLYQKRFTADQQTEAATSTLPKGADPGLVPTSGA